MQDGATGHLIGAFAVVTVRRGENQFQRSQDPEHVFRKTCFSIMLECLVSFEEVCSEHFVSIMLQTIVWSRLKKCVPGK